MKKYNEQIISKDGFVEKLSVQREIYDDESFSACCVEIILYYPSNNMRQKIFFRDAREIKTGLLDHLYIPMICVVDISSNQWENIKYRVYDDEHGLFSFYCKDFTLEEIS